MWIEFTLSLIRVLCLRLIFLLRRSENNTPRVINPRPPIWISVIITICPNVDQCVYVSTTTSPVTHDALADVKRAGIKPML